MTAPDRSRRRLLTGLLAAPAAVLAGGAALELGRRAALVRPAGHGTSAQRCAQCGGLDHLMLADGCPAAPRVVRA